MGGWKIFTRNGGGRAKNGAGGLVLFWGDGKFLVSLHSWQRGSNPLFYENPLYCLPPSFFKFCPTPSPPLPCHLQPPPQLFFRLSCFFGWMGYHATLDVLFYLMIIWIYTCQALVPWYQRDLDVCFMQQGVRFTEVWYIMWFFTGTLIWYHKQTKTQSTLGASRLTHSYKCIFTPLFVFKTATVIILND